MEINQGNMETNQGRMEANVDANQEKIIAKMDAYQERMQAKMDGWLEDMKAWRKKTTACLERKDPTPVDMANVAAHHEDTNGATREETVGQLTTDPGIGV